MTVLMLTPIVGWLIIEFSPGDSAGASFPFRTTTLDPGIEGLIFELPPTFNFEYCTVRPLALAFFVGTEMFLCTT